MMQTSDFIDLYNYIVRQTKPDELEIQIVLDDGTILAADVVDIQLTDFGCYIIQQDEVKAYFFNNPQTISFVPMHSTVEEFLSKNNDGTTKPQFIDKLKGAKK